MPRRNEPDALSLAVGERIRSLRLEKGMTIQELADESETGSKGHLSNIERGLVRPNIHTLKQVADGLGVKPHDLVCFPKKSVRERIVDLTRQLTASQLTEILKEVSRRAEKYGPAAKSGKAAPRAAKGAAVRGKR